MGCVWRSCGCGCLAGVCIRGRNGWCCVGLLCLALPCLTDSTFGPEIANQTCLITFLLPQTSWVRPPGLGGWLAGCLSCQSIVCRGRGGVVMMVIVVVVTNWFAALAYRRGWGGEHCPLSILPTYLPRLPIYLPLPTVHTSLGLLVILFLVWPRVSPVQHLPHLLPSSSVTCSFVYLNHSLTCLSTSSVVFLLSSFTCLSVSHISQSLICFTPVASVNVHHSFFIHHSPSLTYSSTCCSLPLIFLVPLWSLM